MQLRSLEKEGLLIREVKGLKPPQEVVYRLIAKGFSLRTLIDQICEWGVENMLEGEIKNVRKIIRFNTAEVKTSSQFMLLVRNTNSGRKAHNLAEAK